MRVKKVEYVGEYKLRLLFSDKKIKIIDIEPIIKKSKGLFYPLKDIEYFKKVSLDDDQYPFSICWPNGEDLCPDVLYSMGKDVFSIAHSRRSPVKRVLSKRRSAAKIRPITH